MLLKMTMSGDGAGRSGQTGREADARPAAATAAVAGGDRSSGPGVSSGPAAGRPTPTPTGAAAASTTTLHAVEPPAATLHAVEPSAAPVAASVDDERLSRARAGDEAAFADLLRRHQAMVFSLALRIVGNRALAEELAQEVFLQLHRSLATLESGAHVAHWLRRVVSHRAIDLARQMARRPQASLSDLPELSAGLGLGPGQAASNDRRRGGVAASVNPGALGGGHGGGMTGVGSISGAGSGSGTSTTGGDPADPFLTRRLRDLVASLPAAPRAVVTLRFQEDLDLSEIAATLNMPLNTVKSHLRRSLALLRGRAQALLEPMHHVSRT